MAKRYTYETTVQFGSDEGGEFDVKVEFSVAWGSPETGRFGPVEGYDPGSADDVEDVKLLEVNGLTSGWGAAFAVGYQTDAEVADALLAVLVDQYDGMLAEAADSEAGEAERAAEYRAEMRRDDLREGW